MTTDKASALQTIGDATKGLLFPSESDFPIEAFEYGENEPTLDDVRERLGADVNANVEDTTIPYLFEGLTTAPDEASDNEKASATRFAKLVEVLETELADVRVYRVGAVDIDVVVLGRHESGSWLGVKTKVVET